MDVQGRVQFLKHHLGFFELGGVAFCPKDRYLFCTVGFDGRVNLYTAQKASLVQRYAINNTGFARNTSAVRFTCDGRKILATTAGRLGVLDLETGAQLLSYDSCCYFGCGKTGLATDPKCPHTVVSAYLNGKGLSVFDLRMNIPVLFMYDLHTDVITDISFLPESWPWSVGESTLLTSSTDGHGKVVTLDGKALLDITAGSVLSSVAPTPGPFDSMAKQGYSSVIMFGGTEVLGYIPDVGIQESLREHGLSPVTKIRYTSNGSTLFTACESGIIRRYRRYPNHHQYTGEVFRHKLEVCDMDISPYDEYLVTASADRSVGILKLGSPSHGVTEYSELT